MELLREDFSKLFFKDRLRWLVGRSVSKRGAYSSNDTDLKLTPEKPVQITFLELAADQLIRCF